jgi:hypothetical protein
MNICILEVFIINGPVDAEFAKKNPVIYRTLEIRGDQTLAELHKIIFKAFNRFDEHLYEFQLGGKGPNDPKAKKYGVPAQEDEIFNELHMTGSAEQTTLDDLNLKSGRMSK